MFPTIEWSLITLEVLMALSLVTLIVGDLLLPNNYKNDWMGPFSLVALIGLLGFWFTQQHLTGSTFNGMFVMDSLAWYFKGFFLTAMLFVLFITKQYFTALTAERRNEFYMLLWLSVIGMCLIVSSSDLLMLFIAIEIMTLSFYVMTAYLKSDRLSLEAGMKYLILGALASGLFLYSISLMYGIVHSTRFDAIAAYVSTHTMDTMALFSLVLMLSLIGFKIAAVPFHMWVPDVYQGAPTPVTALFSVGSKAAGFVILIRLFLGVFASWHVQWGPIFAILAAVTMCYGNLVAMFQTNIKRLLGYSSIGHAGYLLMGAAAGTTLGVSAMNLYLLGYLFTNLTAFLVIVAVYSTTKSDALDDYAGLSKRSGFLAFAMLLALVSLAGMPPLAGFFGKFSLLMATVQSGYVWLALIAGVNIIISLYYYTMVVKRLYVDQGRDTSPITFTGSTRLAIIIGIIAIITLGIFQAPFFNAATTAAQGMLFIK